MTKPEHPNVTKSEEMMCLMIKTYIKLVHRGVKVVKFLYNLFSPSKPIFLSSDARIMSSAFLQFSLWQSPQAVTHLRPFLWQEYVLVPYGLLEESMHLHCTNYSFLSSSYICHDWIICCHQASNPTAQDPTISLHVWASARALPVIEPSNCENVLPFL